MVSEDDAKQLNYAFQSFALNQGASVSNRRIIK